MRSVWVSFSQGFWYDVLLVDSDVSTLVGGWEHDFYEFPYIVNVIIPTDELIYFSEG